MTTAQLEQMAQIIRGIEEYAETLSIRNDSESHGGRGSEKYTNAANEKLETLRQAITEHLADFAALTRAAALEEAAKACEDVDPVTYTFGGQLHDDARGTLGACVEAIRALAKQEGGDTP